jgi:hypothetical protein
MTQLQQDLSQKEKSFIMFQEAIQEHKETRKPSISIAYANTMTKTSLVKSPSIDISQDKIHEFKIFTKGIGSKILKKMGYDGQGI